MPEKQRLQLRSETALDEIVQGLQAGVVDLNELLVTGGVVVFVRADDEVHGVIVDGVDMLLVGGLAQQGHDGALGDGGVEEEVVVGLVGLVGVTRPAPAVPLDAVQEELAGVEVEGVGADVPDLLHVAAVAGPPYQYIPDQ